MIPDKKEEDVVSVLARHFTAPTGAKSENAVQPLADPLFLARLTQELLPGERNKSNTKAATEKRMQRLRAKVFDAAFTGSLIENFPSAYERAWYNCSRTIVLCQVLIMKNERAIARPLMLQTFSEARKFEFTAMALQLAGMLRLDTALAGNKIRYRFCCRHERELGEVLQAEIKAGQYANRFFLDQKKRFSFAHATVELLKKAAKETEAWSKKYGTHALRLHRFRIWQCLLIMQYEPHKVIDVCTKFLHYLKSAKKFSQPQQLGETTLYIMDACLESRQPQKGLRYVIDCSKYYKEYRGNWFRFHEIHFMLQLHAGNYQRAMELHRQLSNYVYRKTHSSNLHISGAKVSGKQLKADDELAELMERWILYKVYLSCALNNKRGLEMLPQSLLNKIPQYEMDKKGLAFAIHIAELIVLIQGNHEDRLEDFKERFTQYVKRHLNRKKQYRSYCCSKLVNILFKNNFNPSRSLKAGTVWYERLCSKHSLLDYEMIEVIQYEKLWKVILKSLPEKGLSHGE